MMGSLSNIKNLIIILLLIVISFELRSQVIQINKTAEDTWVDSVYNSLTVEQRVAQLIFVRANYSGEPYIQDIDSLIQDYNIGGVVFF